MRERSLTFLLHVCAPEFGNGKKRGPSRSANLRSHKLCSPFASFQTKLFLVPKLKHLEKYFGSVEMIITPENLMLSLGVPSLIGIAMSIYAYGVSKRWDALAFATFFSASMIGAVSYDFSIIIASYMEGLAFITLGSLALVKTKRRFWGIPPIILVAPHAFFYLPGLLGFTSYFPIYETAYVISIGMIMFLLSSSYRNFLLICSFIGIWLTRLLNMVYVRMTLRWGVEFPQIKVSEPLVYGTGMSVSLIMLSIGLFFEFKTARIGTNEKDARAT